MAKKRKEARNIMKFGKNIDLERKYFDQWKTKGTSNETKDPGFIWSGPLDYCSSIDLLRMNQNVIISVFGPTKKKKRKRAKTEGENLDSSESQKNVRFEPQKVEQPRTVVKKKVRKKISKKLG